jgi:hypothetical protein
LINPGFCLVELIPALHSGGTPRLKGGGIYLEKSILKLKPILVLGNAKQFSLRMDK